MRTTLRTHSSAGARRHAPIVACAAVALALLTLAGGASAQRPTLTHLYVSATGIAYARSTRSLYVAVAARSVEHPASLLEVDPSSGSVRREIAIGGDPYTLSVSDEDRTAYVADFATSSVVRVDLSTGRVVSRFTPALDGYEREIRPAAVASAPGRPGTVAVSLFDVGFGSSVAIAVYDDGVRRPRTITDFPAGQLLFDGDRLWANTSSGAGQGATLRRLDVGADGLSWDGRPDAVAGYGDVSLEGRRLYTATGQIVDADTGRQVGWIPDSYDFAAGGHAVDTAGGTVTYALNGASFTAMFVYDLSVGRLVASFDGGDYDQRAGVYSMVDCGTAGVATLDGYGVTFYPRSAFVPYPPYERPEPRPQSGGVRAIPLPNRALVYDDKRKLIYASVSPDVVGIGNSVVVVDPAAGEVGRAVPVGSVPDVLALSSDRSKLYVATAGSYGVVRCGLPRLKSELAFDTERGPYGPDAGPYPTIAGAILPLPGAPGSVAVLHTDYVGQSAQGVAVYDDGVARPRVAPYGGDQPTSIALDPTGTTMYGIGGVGGTDFLTYAISSDGVSAPTRHPLVGVGYPDRLHAVGNVCYSDFGAVIDGASSTRIGLLPPERGGYERALVATDPERGVVYQLLSGPEGYDVTSYDMTTLARRATVHVPPRRTTFVRDLFVWGRGKQLGFSTGEAIVLLPVKLLRP